MACNCTSTCNKCQPKPLCGCPIDLSSFCVRYTLNKRLTNINVNEGDNLQDILIKLDNQIGTILSNQGNTVNLQFFDGKLLYQATGGETFITLVDIVNTNLNFQLYRNGQLDVDGVGNEYTVDNTTNRINLTNQLEQGEIIQFFYYKQ